MNIRSVLLVATFAVATSAEAQQPFMLQPGFRASQLGTFQVTPYVGSILPLPDGKVIISGQFNLTGQPAAASSFIRLLPNGLRDPSFLGWGSPNGGSGGGGALKQWGDMVYVSPATTVRRYNLSDGVEDPTFDMYTNSFHLFSPVQSGDYHLYPDGSIVISGAHILNDTANGSQGMYSLIWFTNTGHLDQTKQHRWCNGVIYEIHEQPDGKFLCSGPLSEYEGTPVPQTFRVHPDGELDTSFDASAIAWGEVNRFSVLDDGRIIASGVLKSSFSSPDTLQIVRLMPDGSLDPSFNNMLEARRLHPPYLDKFIEIWHTMLPDGRILLHGNFREVDGEPRVGIALLDADGYVLDDAFTGAGCGTYQNGQVIFHLTMGAALAPDGSLFIHGSYIGFDDGFTNDPGQRMISKLYGPTVGIAVHEAFSFSLYPNPATTYATVQLEQLPRNGVLVLRDALGREVLRQRVAGYHNTVPLQGLGRGVYLLELWDAGQRLQSEQLVVQP